MPRIAMPEAAPKKATAARDASAYRRNHPRYATAERIIVAIVLALKTSDKVACMASLNPGCIPREFIAQKV
jgi:hypothetical protein